MEKTLITVCTCNHYCRVERWVRHYRAFEVGITHDLVFFNNKSDPAFVDWFEENYPELELVAMEENRYPIGTAVHAFQSFGDYDYYFFNTDDVVPVADLWAFWHKARVAEDPDLAVVGFQGPYKRSAKDQIPGGSYRGHVRSVSMFWRKEALSALSALNLMPDSVMTKEQDLMCEIRCLPEAIIMAGYDFDQLFPCTRFRHTNDWRDQFHYHCIQNYYTTMWDCDHYGHLEIDRRLNI